MFLLGHTCHPVFCFVSVYLFSGSGDQQKGARRGGGGAPAFERHLPGACSHGERRRGETQTGACSEYGCLFLSDRCLENCSMDWLHAGLA